jgi:excisionase family DNA binding protein
MTREKRPLLSKMSNIAPTSAPPPRGAIPRPERPAAPEPEMAEPGQPHTIPETAERLGCSPATARRRIAAGDLVAVRHGRILRVLESDLQAFIRASRRWR